MITAVVVSRARTIASYFPSAPWLSALEITYNSSCKSKVSVGFRFTGASGSFAFNVTDGGDAVTEVINYMIGCSISSSGPPDLC
ncbi:hypothetical protein DPMN_126998 [Dreissena polymorpha]|uniref:Uncharacterized protein n=1 Tax=Dreissena polymorpha TaxID=45954 RepID=A0A9D4JUG0_DREPO|nr:hypothetical protein DPMN_126998 [Dreissena polymorpha]